jgi:hypothetical protein
LLAVAIGSVGLLWGTLNVSVGSASDDFLDLETHLLQFETFSANAAKRLLEDASLHDLAACDNHAQRALLISEIPLADAALRNGAVQDYDRHVHSIEARTRRTLSCVPRDSFVWLVAFGLEIQHGTLDKHAFDLLATSYETSPREAWIAMRRVVVAVPVMLQAPEPVRDLILTEFQDLVRGRLLELPARSFVNAPAPVRALLQSRIDQLDANSRRAFSEALDKFHS